MAFLSRKLLAAGGEFETPPSLTRVGTTYDYQLLSVGTTLTLDISGISTQNNDYLYLFTTSEQGQVAGPTSGQGFTNIHTEFESDSRDVNMNVSYVQLNGTETSFDTAISGSISFTSSTIHAFAVVYRAVSDPFAISGGTSTLSTHNSANDRDPTAAWNWSSSLDPTARHLMFHANSNFYNNAENWDSSSNAVIGSKVQYQENHFDAGPGSTRGQEIYFLELSNLGNNLSSGTRATGSSTNSEGIDSRVTITFAIN